MPDDSPTRDRAAYQKAYRQTHKATARRVNVTLSRDEFEKIASDAAVHSLPVTTHLRECAFAYLDGRYIVPPDLASRMDALLAVLRGIGNNLNQLARHSNEMRYFLDTEEVRLQVRRLDEEIRRFVSEPAREGEGCK